ncbi:short chain dehydrogenase [Geodermatophilus amargosae]|uniref:Short chain dehydrogenase n=1 Tax=Geodermatophilus amargosae TaxID=1296565 RepID=A0A1I7BHV7_9ACTN|nr:SDR family NAD(P)-dependent oxidoreductase [Geodermatophilus amargosae]SFT86770.1 short chain dehydrogenase [Geodermatophilus amargosae]
MQITNRVAVVTGAGGGLGPATARRLIAAGGRVALPDAKTESLEKAQAELGDRALSISVDVTDASAVEAAVDTTVTAFGAVHVCVNGAGIAPAAKVVSRGRPCWGRTSCR